MCDCWCAVFVVCFCLRILRCYGLYVFVVLCLLCCSCVVLLFLLLSLFDVSVLGFCCWVFVCVLFAVAVVMFGVLVF